MGIRVVSEGEIRTLIGPAQALAECREAFGKLGRDEVVLPDVMFFDLEEQEGEVHVKGAYLNGAPYFSIKVASGFYRNPERGLPIGSGAVWVFDAVTGLLDAILFDNGYLTDLRTGAAGALAADLLARRSISQVGILGCGGQARYQLEALLGVREPTRVVAYCRTAESLDRYVREVEERFRVPTTGARDAREVVEGSDLIITTTPARDPIVLDEWVAPGTHVTAVGSDLPEKQELDPALLGRAKVIADRLSQCLTQGEIHHAVAAGVLHPDAIHAQLGEIVIGRKAGRESDEEITVADLTGVGVLDAAMANFVALAASEEGSGAKLEIQG